MSAYPWIRRHKRYLSFRYIFPEVAASWIHFKRFLLRLMWFFTHPVDEFLDDIRDALLWPFSALHTLWRWMVIGVHEFFKDLIHGIEATFGWLGRLPVWTGAALSGVMGILLTILLFLLPALDGEIVTASIPQTPPPQQATAGILSSLPDWKPTAPAESEFDIFQEKPQREYAFPTRDERLPDVRAYLTRLSMPFGWDSRKQVSVVSTPTTSPRREEWMAFERMTQLDGWERPRFDRVQRGLHFTPYMSRGGVRSTRVAPSWIRPESTVEPLSQFASQRHPAVVVEKTAPTRAPVGQALQYSLIVENRGDETLDSVTVREQVSAIERVSNVSPSASVVGDSLVWDLTDLRPGEKRRLTVELLPNQELTLAHNSVVEVTTGVAAVSNVRHPRPEPPVAEPMPPQSEPEPEPEAPSSFLPEFFPEPAEEPEPETDPMIEEPFPQIIPFWEDDEPEADVPPQVETPPPFETPEPVRIENPLSLEMFAPRAVVTGGDLRTVFEVENRGQTDITDLVLAVDLTDELNHKNGRTLELRITRVAVGEVFRTRLTTAAVKDGTAMLSSRLTSAQSDAVSVEREVRISQDVAPPTDVVFDVMPCQPFPCGGPPRF